MLEVAKKPFEITQRAISTHAFSGRLLKDYPSWLEALLQVKAAAARANFAASNLNEEEQAWIEEACKQLMLLEYRDLFQADVYQGGGGIAVHMNINEAIQAFIQETGKHLDIKTQINASQSTSDVLSTASFIALQQTGNELLIVLEDTARILEEKAIQFSAVQTMARTCLRDAMPAPLSELFRGYSLLVQRQIKELRTRLSAFEEGNLGGTVIGSGEGASLTYQGVVIPFLSELTGLPLKRRENLFDAAQNSDAVGALSAALSQLAASWIKITKDLRLMASGPLTGLDEISLPQAIPGSSFFEDKVNPTLPETVLQACFLVLGNHRVVESAQEHAELYLNVFDTCACLKTLESLELLLHSFKKFNQFCLMELQANEATCRRWVSIWESRKNV